MVCLLAKGGNGPHTAPFARLKRTLTCSVPAADCLNDRARENAVRDLQSNRHWWKGQFSVLADPGFGPIFAILARNGAVFGIGASSPRNHLKLTPGGPSFGELCFIRPCRKIPGFRPSPHRGERRVPWPASRGRNSTRSTSLRTRRIYAPTFQAQARVRATVVLVPP